MGTRHWYKKWVPKQYQKCVREIGIKCVPEIGTKWVPINFKFILINLV